MWQESKTFFPHFIYIFYFLNLLSGQLYTYSFYVNFVSFLEKPWFRRGQNSQTLLLIEYSLKQHIHYKLLIFSFMLLWATIRTYTRTVFMFIYLTIHKNTFWKKYIFEIFFTTFHLIFILSTFILWNLRKCILIIFTKK